MDEGWRFGFFQAVRLLQLMAPESVSVGAGDDPNDECVRFSSRVSLSFPPGEIHEIRPSVADDDMAEMVVNFMGLASPASYGSLPMPYTELILTQEREKHSALRQFLDLFNHRLVSLFYRAWEKYRFGVVYERAGRNERGLFEQALFAVMGIGTSGLQERLAVNSRALLARAHAVGGRGISAMGLAALIRDYFRVPAQVVQFIPAWYQIEDSEVCRLGVQSSHLGEDLCLGSRTRMAQSRFRVQLGPLSWRQMSDFLPDGSAFGALAEVCTLVTGPEFDFEFHLKLASGQTPPLRLGVSDDSGTPRLGWSTWLRRSDGEDQSAAVIINGESKVADLPLSA
jgi:type VI secretion system protein ImpH